MPASKTLWLGLMASLAALAMSGVSAAAQQSRSSDSGFSFAVYGDSRPMMYLPYKEGQPDLNKLFVEMFGLVLPEKVAEEVVKRGKDDLRSCHQGAHQGHHAICEQDRSHDANGRQGLGDRGFCRGCEIASRRAPHDGIIRD
jgi:hypothetical protein